MPVLHAAVSGRVPALRVARDVRHFFFVNTDWTEKSEVFDRNSQRRLLEVRAPEASCPQAVAPEGSMSEARRRLTGICQWLQHIYTTYWFMKIFETPYIE